MSGAIDNVLATIAAERKTLEAELAKLDKAEAALGGTKPAATGASPRTVVRSSA